MVINSIGKSNYSLYKRKENKQAPSFGFKINSEKAKQIAKKVFIKEGPNGIDLNTTTKVLIHDGANLGIGAAISHFADLPFFTSFAIGKAGGEALNLVGYVIKTKGNITKLRQLIGEKDPSSVFRPFVAALDIANNKMHNLLRNKKLNNIVN